MKALFSIALIASPLAAAERTLSVSDFDRLRVEGGFTVEVRTGPATSARIVGAQRAIEAASVVVQGRQLVIRRNRSNWGGYPGQEPPAATIRITTPALSSAWISGPARVTIDRMRGLRVGVSLEGSGTLTVAQVQADRLDISTLGSGTLTLGGSAAQLTAVTRGAGVVDAAALQVADARLTSESAGAVTLAVKRAANVTMSGVGSVTILGKPACTVRNIGAGTVTCGSDQPERR